MIATEQIDFTTRSGRFTADKLAAIAADLWRNQTEETDKGSTWTTKARPIPVSPSRWFHTSLRISGASLVLPALLQTDASFFRFDRVGSACVKFDRCFDKPPAGSTSCDLNCQAWADLLFELDSTSRRTGPIGLKSKQRVCVKFLDEEGLQEGTRSGGEELVRSYCGNELLVSELSEVVPDIFSSLRLEWARADLRTH